MKDKGKLAITLIAIAVILVAMTQIVINSQSDNDTGDYHEVSYKYTVEYKWNNTCPYYVIEFDAKNDGYFSMNLGYTSSNIRTDAMYHKGHNIIQIPTEDVITKPNDLRFYERR